MIRVSEGFDLVSVPVPLGDEFVTRKSEPSIRISNALEDL